MPAVDPAAQSRSSLQALAGLVERASPWLVEVGSWILGGLIALNLVVIAALVTVGPVDAAIMIAAAAFACALPLDVVGVVLLRLMKDVKDVRLDDLALQAFQDAHFPNIEAYYPARRERQSLEKRRAIIALGYAAGIAVLSVALTLTGIVAALWHMAPWIAEAFLATVALSAALVVVAVANSLPPESQAEQELKRRSHEPRLPQRGEPRSHRDQGSRGGHMSEPTVTQRRGALSLACRVQVNVRAPAERIWTVLTDAEGFPRWNSTVTSIEGEIREGAKLKVRVPGTERVFSPRISDVVPNERMTWTGGVSPIFKGVRTFELRTRDAGSTEFTMAERFTGLMIPFVKRSLPDFGPVFARYADDLRREAERPVS